MSKYADYDFYTNTYNGTMAESDFEREILRASAYIDHITIGRIIPANLEKFQEKISLAACAVADECYMERKGGELASQTVGPWTKVYKGSGKTADQRKAEAAETYLLMTGLLYRGGGA